MCSADPKRCLVVLDVGHGSAAILHDEGGVVVFDTGRGPTVDRHLHALGIREIEAMLLSHADADHIGGAITLLLDSSVRVASVFLNPDPSKNSDVFQQLRYALSEAELRTQTKIEPSLTTSSKFPRTGASIEVLYPPAPVALGGVGGGDLRGKRLTSNSLSAAVRVTGAPGSSVLLGGDIEFGCLEYWMERGLTPSARVLVFPHHGGLPGDGDESEASLFAHQLSSMVNPETVIFSIHRTRFGLPRNEVVTAVLKAVKNVRFACTQLPERFHQAVDHDVAWSLHMNRSGGGYQEGSIELVFSENALVPRFFFVG